MPDPQLPSPQTTLVILLGASQWPLCPEFTKSQAFVHSAHKLKSYFLQSNQFGLPSENLLDLFDTLHKPDEIDQAIGTFLEDRIEYMKQKATPARDLLFYYIGHGMMSTGYDQARYHLAIRSTREDNIGASAVAMATLAHTLKTKARRLRRIIILDCCFAAEAFKYMQSTPAQIAIQEVNAAFEEKSKGSGIPSKGTSLLCSSGNKQASFILPDETGTMFSEAFVHVLSHRKPYPSSETYFSLYDLRSLIAEFSEKAVLNPEVHSPDQSEGDVAHVPFFPTPSASSITPQMPKQPEPPAPANAPTPTQQEALQPQQLSLDELLIQNNAPVSVQNIAKKQKINQRFYFGNPPEKA